MVPIINIRGFTAPDPLDRAPAGVRLALTIGVSGVVALIFLYVQSYTLHIVRYESLWVFWIGCALYAFVMGSLLAVLRKSSSLLFYLLIVIVCGLTDVWLHAHYRDQGLTAWWSYEPDTFIYAIPVPLRFLVAWSFDGLIQGALVLWFARLIAGAVYPADQSKPEPTLQQQEALFPDEWTNEVVAKPVRDAGFWVLRLVGLGYFAYLVFCLIGLLGSSPWPEQARMLIDMTYQNKALAINTFSKLSLMVLLAFIGAYNRNVRFYSTLGLLAGHLASTLASLAFYFYDPPGNYPGTNLPTYRDFLLTSALVDGVMVLAFIWILARSRADSRMFAPRIGFSDYVTLPDQLAKMLLSAIALLLGLMIPGFVLFRVLGDGVTGLAAVFGYPDPQLCNTITMLATMTVVALLVARREKLRDYLVPVLVLGFVITLIGKAGFVAVAGMLDKNGIVTRTGLSVTVDWYFVSAALLDAVAIALIIGVRKMYYNIDYVINALNPSSAQNVTALHEAVYRGGPVENAAVLQKIDRYIASIEGRKRGLLNFPFWIVEHIFSPLFGLRPTFSNMSSEEGRFFLRKYMLRPPRERARAFIPAVADIAYKIGMAVHAFITFAHFTYVKGWEEVGYIPPDARDRLQGDNPSAPPPFVKAAALPDDPASPANNKPDIAPPRPLVAPRVSTPFSEPSLPDEVDYLIIGSGAGGACMAYRLACEASDPSRILLADRGRRFSPLQDFNDDEMGMYCKLYKEGGLQQSKRFDLMVLQGECVGGTTVINNAVCLPMPAEVRSEWENQYGLDLSALGRYDGNGWPTTPGEYSTVEKEIEITEIPDLAVNQRVKEKFLNGVEKYNKEHQSAAGPALIEERLRANQRDMMGDGLCNLGNKRLRKRSMLETYIPWAEARGVQVIGGTSGVCFLTDKSGRKAEAVLLRTAHGVLRKVNVRKAVIVAGGVIASSHFLMRSKIWKNVGQGMSCNFAFPVAFEFPDLLDSFDGTQITLAAIDNQQKPNEPPRAAFETYSNPPGAFATSLPFYFERSHDLMKRYRRLVNFGALVGSEPNGVIELKADLINGRPYTWRLGDDDRTKIRFALTTLLELGLAAGASRVVLPTEPGLEIPLTRANVSRFKSAIESYPLRLSDLRLTTAHPQGGNRMMGDTSAYKSQRVLDGDFRVEGFENVFVADASVFPTGITVNPQWTIMALSSMAAKKVLAFGESKARAARP